MINTGRFFTAAEFENELNLDANLDVLNRIKEDSTINKDEMIFSFYYITNEKSKIEALSDFLKINEPEQKIIEFNKINSIWELHGMSNPIRLEIDNINEWEKKMWEIGFRFDCKLDGWETTYENR